MRTLSILLYNVFILLITPLIILTLVIRSVSQAAYRQRLPERLGLLPRDIEKTDIVIHGASVGEIIALKPLISALLTDNANYRITVTSFTPTGSQQIQKMFGNRVQHCYLPIDNIVSVNLFLRRLKPALVVIMETELWPTLIHNIKNSGAKLLLVNGRLSAKSVKRYCQLSALVVPVLDKFDFILTQSEDNKQNFITIGAGQDKTLAVGNLKYDLSLSSAIKQKVIELESSRLENKRFWVVGSTHPADEPLILDCFSALKKHAPELVLVLVPRHPERFDKVANELEERGFNTIRRSQNQALTSSTDVWLVDTLGELLPFYALADVCTIGGSFGGIGGHNPLEPALFSKPILVGPDMANFVDITNKLIEANGIKQLADNGELTLSVVEMLEDKSMANNLGSAAHSVVLANQGATSQTIEYVKRLLNQS